MSHTGQVLENLYTLFLQGDTKTLLTLYSAEPVMDTPLSGRVQGTEAIEQAVQTQQCWLQEREVTPELLASIDTENRFVAEFVLFLNQANERIDLPVAVVADLEGEAVTSLRVYHSTWPLTGTHLIRTPLLSFASHLEEPEVVEAYMNALTQPDEEAILALFTTDGYVREPSGSRYKHEGAQGRKAFYDQILTNGGVPLKHCSATFNGTLFAVEYVCDTWGQAHFAPQAGMAMYELADADHIRAVRIYDDVTPPL